MTCLSSDYKWQLRSSDNYMSINKQIQLRTCFLNFFSLTLQSLKMLKHYYSFLDPKRLTWKTKQTHSRKDIFKGAEFLPPFRFLELDLVTVNLFKYCLSLMCRQNPPSCPVPTTKPVCAVIIWNTCILRGKEEMS